MCWMLSWLYLQWWRMFLCQQIKLLWRSMWTTTVKEINLLKNSINHNNRNCLIRGPQVGAIAKRFPIIHGVSWLLKSVRSNQIVIRCRYYDICIIICYCQESFRSRIAALANTIKISTVPSSEVIKSKFAESDDEVRFSVFRWWNATEFNCVSHHCASRWDKKNPNDPLLWYIHH